MKHPSAKKQFSDWSREWKSARKKVGDIDCVIELWRRPMPSGWKRNEWSGQLGFRKNHAPDGEDRGEQKIERLFLGESGIIKRLDCYYRNSIYSLNSIYHNLPLANQSNGQVIADSFAVIKVKKSFHPLLIEIKTTDRNCWYALVENLQQVRLARACEVELRSQFANKTGAAFSGAWGLVLAPEEYFTNTRTSAGLEKCRELLDKLKKTKTAARIAFGTTDELANGKIKIHFWNWL